MSGKEIYDLIKVDFVSRSVIDDVFDLSKYTIKYNNKQVTITFYDFKKEYSEKGEIILRCLQDFIHITESDLNFNTYIRKLNYKLPHDLNDAKVDFKNCLKIEEGFKRLFSRDDFKKLCHFFNLNY